MLELKSRFRVRKVLFDPYQMHELLFACGWQGDETERGHEAFMMSTTYASLWSRRPSAVVKTLRRTLKAALLEAGLKDD